MQNQSKIMRITFNRSNSITMKTLSVKRILQTRGNKIHLWAIEVPNQGFWLANLSHVDVQACNRSTIHVEPPWHTFPSCWREYSTSQPSNFTVLPWTWCFNKCVCSLQEWRAENSTVRIDFHTDLPLNLTYCTTHALSYVTKSGNNNLNEFNSFSCFVTKQVNDYN